MNHRTVIDNWCHDHNMSYAGFARKCGLYVETIELVVRGNIRLTAKIAAAVEAATGLSALGLLTRQAADDLEKYKSKEREQRELQASH
jgi:plasmid maintenance system antidote protein VapI